MGKRKVCFSISNCRRNTVHSPPKLDAGKRSFLVFGNRGFAPIYLKIEGRNSIARRTLIARVDLPCPWLRHVQEESPVIHIRLEELHLSGFSTVFVGVLVAERVQYPYVTQVHYSVVQPASRFTSVEHSDPLT